jgi:hypothetical protein
MVFDMETPIQVPEGCVCGDDGWNPPIPPVCGEFVPHCDSSTCPADGNCGNCEHDKACHKEAK